ncbi:hypothetical protein HYU07_04380 [Candidatus Woesearchaeota archaeon]|nr:hypothetical protein [Candidatus Woesearchaeota archaeon]
MQKRDYLMIAVILLAIILVSSFLFNYARSNIGRAFLGNPQGFASNASTIAMVGIIAVFFVIFIAALIFTSKPKANNKI